ncbi:hypothetical protein ACLKA6_001024 [Drosophila palustris]
MASCEGHIVFMHLSNCNGILSAFCKNAGREAVTANKILVIFIENQHRFFEFIDRALLSAWRIPSNFPP